MSFAQPEYDLRIVDLAGDALIGAPDIDIELRDGGYDARAVVNNWRNAHQYPLNTFQVTLRNRAKKVDNTSIVAQRIKRLSSIDDKLQRFHANGLTLSKMQDIAGCRAIVDTISSINQLVDDYKRSYSLHVLDSYNDYIRSPKSSGYRGYHLIYRYRSVVHPEYNDLKIEMQFRSGLQHCWATAVETTDIFHGEGLKASRGSPDWTRFFALMGSAMAIREGCRRVPRTPRDDGELVHELSMLEEKLHVRENLRAFGETLKLIDESKLNRTNLKWIILVPDQMESGEPTLTFYAYGAADLAEASEQLRELERFRARGADAVLVSVADAANLKRAFPNYYLDTAQFLDAYDDAVS